MSKIAKYFNIAFIIFMISSSHAYASEYEDFIVSNKSSSSYTVNLFDYWIHDTNTSSDYVDPSNTMYSGINNNHLLMFRKYKAAIEGDWNLWRRYTPYSNMVSYTLDSTNYPYLNITNSSLEKTTNLKNRQNESLAYLFDPNYENNTYRLAYKDVKGLLLHNETVGDYYDSTQNFASYDESSNTFDIYSSPGIIGSGFGTYSDSNYQNKNFGQFFPFNKPSDIFDIVDNELQNKSNMQTGNSAASILNHYFGLTLEANFKQPEFGLLKNDSTNGLDEMIFTFSGDDDIWIYIDGYMIADIGGIHDALKTEINFATGIVTIIPCYEKAQTEENTNKYFIGEILEQNSDVTEEYISNNLIKEVDSEGNITRYTYKDNTKHIFKVFYLERGNTDSNLSMAFFPSINGTLLSEELPTEPSPDPDTQSNPKEDNDSSNNSEDSDSSKSNPNTGNNIVIITFISISMLIIILVLVLLKKKIVKKEYSNF